MATWLRRQQCTTSMLFNDTSCYIVPHIDRLIRTGFYRLCRLRVICRLITTAMAIQLVDSFIVTNIDYYTSLLPGLPAHQLDRVQSVLNYAVCLVYGRGKYDHVTLLLRNHSHWLCVQERVTLKCCLVGYKALNGQASGYITDFCVRVPVFEWHFTLRVVGSIGCKLVVPWRVSKFAERSFSVSGRNAWNFVLNYVKSSTSFGISKSRLKSHLYRVTFPWLS